MIKTGIVGFGMSASVFHCPLVESNPHLKLAAVVERHGDKSKQQYPNIKLARSIDELLAMDSIELVVVTTPNDTHVPYAKQILSSGKHCVVEKPLAPTEAEALELVQLAKQSGKVLSVFQNRRWDGDYLTLKNLLREHALGRVVEIESRFDRYRTYKKPSAWREDGDFPASGVLFDLGAHLFDQVNDLFGAPEFVTGTIRNERQLDNAADDSFLVVMDYPSKNFRAVCRAGMLVRDKPPRFTAFGTNGTFTKYGLDVQEGQLKEGMLPTNAIYGKDIPDNYGVLDSEIYPDVHVRGKVATVDGSYSAYYNNVAAAIKDQEPLAVTPEQAAMVVRVIELAKLSSAERKSIPFA